MLFKNPSILIVVVWVDGSVMTVLSSWIMTHLIPWMRCSLSVWFLVLFWSIQEISDIYGSLLNSWWQRRPQRCLTWSQNSRLHDLSNWSRKTRMSTTFTSHVLLQKLFAVSVSWLTSVHVAICSYLKYISARPISMWKCQLLSEMEIWRWGTAMRYWFFSRNLLLLTHLQNTWESQALPKRAGPQDPRGLFESFSTTRTLQRTLQRIQHHSCNSVSEFMYGIKDIKPGCFQSKRSGNESRTMSVYGWPISKAIRFKNPLYWLITVCVYSKKVVEKEVFVTHGPSISSWKLELFMEAQYALQRQSLLYSSSCRPLTWPSIDHRHLEILQHHGRVRFDI